MIFSILTYDSIHAQEVFPLLVETYTSAEASIEFAIQEVMINSGTDGNNDLRQEYHQTLWSSFGIIN